MAQTTKSSNLHQKLLNVIKSIGTVKKSGYNKYQGYSYPTEKDLKEAVKPHLVEQGLAYTESVENVNVKQIEKSEGKDPEFITTATVKFTVYDIDNPSDYIELYSVGQGHDKLDKGIYKARTGASKYFLTSNFMIATEDDPEKDNVSSVNKQNTKNNGFSSFSKNVSKAKNSSFGKTSKFSNNNKSEEKSKQEVVQHQSEPEMPNVIEDTSNQGEEDVV